MISPLVEEELEILPNEKFACMVLSFFDAKIQSPAGAELGYGCNLSRSLPFSLTGWVHRWLGEFIVEQLQTSPRVVLTTKQPSSNPGTFDGENQVLADRVAHFLWGISAVAGVPIFNLGRLFSGSNVAGEIKIRHSATVENFYRSAGMPPMVGLRELARAVKFAQHLDIVMRRKTENPRAYWRLVSGTNAFVNGLKNKDDEERLHHFVRAIESFQPASGSSRRDFVRYAACLVARPQSDSVRKTFEEMYDLRSAAEHHRHFAERALPDVEAPEECARRRTRQAEVLARELFNRFVAGEPDSLEFFRDEPALELAWAEPQAIKTAWGELLDLDTVS